MRRALTLLMLAACLAAPGSAASAAGTAGAGRGRPRATTTAPAKRPASGRVVAAVKAPRDSTRTLDAVHIEGELDVPEVLFITARDQRRIVEFHHRRYLRTSAELLRDAPPTRLVVARGAVSPTAPAPSASGDPR